MSRTHLRVTAGLAQPQQREQQLLLFSWCQAPLPSQALRRLGQQLRRDGRGGSQAALSVLAAVEMALYGAELQSGGVLVLWREA